MRAIQFLVVLFLFCSISHAEEIRAADDASLRAALRNAKAGDVIRIAGGEYRGGLSATLAGTEDQPILIEGDVEEPPVIVGGGAGLHLVGARHVTLRHLHFRGASGNGINIDDGGAARLGATGIVIEHVRVSEVGPRGNTDGIKLSGITTFAVRDCVVEGWGGSAVDMVGCHDGVIERCTFCGREGFGNTTGPQMKGGSANITIRQCRFDNAGMRAINCGGSTGLQFFRPIDANYEAKDITIEGNVFRGGDAPVAFVGVDGATFRGNVIYEPRNWVLRILQESTSERFVPCRNVRFHENVIVYRRSLRSIVNIGPHTQPESFTFDSNTWWCPDAPNARPELPSRETNGTYGKDPQVQLDDSGVPVLPRP